MCSREEVSKAFPNSIRTTGFIDRCNASLSTLIEVLPDMRNQTYMVAREIATGCHERLMQCSSAFYTTGLIREIHLWILRRDHNYH